MSDTAPIRLRLSRAKGFDLQLFSRGANGLPAINVARPSRWGNPWVIRREGRLWVIQHPGHREERATTEADARFLAVTVCYRPWLHRQPALCAAAKAKLRGHNLACWCPWPVSGKPDYCHAAALLEIANA